MSSTNRGEPAAVIYEGYATQSWTVRRLLDRIAHQIPTGDKARWLEPCAGDGDIIRAVKPLFPDITWTACEYNPRFREALEKLVGKSRVRISNFLDQSVRTRFDVAMFNPPFSIAQEVVEKALEHADHVIMYERLNWFATNKRHKFLTTFCPDIYVLPNRPKHTGNKKHDSVEYAWYHWTIPEQRKISYGTIELLDLTPLEERKQG